jgi:hypothetical protein
MLIATTRGLRDTETGQEYRVELLGPDTLVSPDSPMVPGGLLVEFDPAELAALSVETRIKLLKVLISANGAAFAEFEIVSPTTPAANMLFAFSVAAILGLAIRKL